MEGRRARRPGSRLADAIAPVLHLGVTALVACPPRLDPSENPRVRTPVEAAEPWLAPREPNSQFGNASKRPSRPDAQHFRRPT